MSHLEELREFCIENGVDDQAREKIEEGEPWEIDAVLAQGCLTGARNPSATMISRLKAVQKGKGKGRCKGAKGFDNWSDRVQQEVEDYIWQKELDTRAADAIKECDERVAKELLRRPMDDARNPSAVCLSLIKRIEQEFQGKGGKGKGKGGKDDRKGGYGGGKDRKGYGGRDGGKGKRDGKNRSVYEGYGKDQGKGYTPY